MNDFQLPYVPILAPRSPNGLQRYLFHHEKILLHYMVISGSLSSATSSSSLIHDSSLYQSEIWKKGREDEYMLLLNKHSVSRSEIWLM